MTTLTQLLQNGHNAYLLNSTSLDKYFGKNSTILKVATDASLIELSKIYETLYYPGVEGIEAAIENTSGDNTLTIFQVMDSRTLSGLSNESSFFRQSDFFYDLKSEKFLDPFDVYHAVRGDKLQPKENNDPKDHWKMVADGAVFLSRYQYTADPVPNPPPEALPLSPFEQRILLIAIMEGTRPWIGFSYLETSGFLQAHWPILAAMDNVLQGKEYHPEGNVWEHTIETFRYRKTRDLVLSLALLLHDCGKPHSSLEDGNPFNRHAQIGARKSSIFLQTLGFENQIIDDVKFLVAEHMLPEAIPRLPFFRTEKSMSHPLFPLLLELYRCDISSTYRGPDGYYQACKTYRAFLKNRNNPFRTSDGKKLLRLYVE